MSIGAYHFKKSKLIFLKELEDSPLPLTRKSMAEALDLSESTITRAIYQK